MIHSSLGDLDKQALIGRLGAELYAKRITRQQDKFRKFFLQGRGIFRLQRILPFEVLLNGILKFTGLQKTMRADFLNVQLENKEWFFSNLPESFEGFQILQLTDLHCDLEPELMPLVIDLVKQTPHDAAVLTGDYRNRIEGSHEETIRAMKQLGEALSAPSWGILGNHDSLEMVPELERDGLPILLNEMAEIRRGEDSLWIAGVDDPHYFKTHDLEATRRKAPENAFVILLSHSPETYAEAAQHGFALQLSGHTHGGQICLPGGRHVLVPCKIPRRFVAGAWSHRTLQGYTSRGTGGCVVAARWNCPPEVTLHTLRRARKA